MKKKITYYDVLDVEKDASVEDIKIAYIQKAKEIHPDIKGNSYTANKKMALLNKAYQVLIDPISRQNYYERLEQIKFRDMEDIHSTDNKKQEIRHSKMKWPTILFLIIIFYIVNLFIQTKLNKNNIPGVIPTASNNSSGINSSVSYPTSIPEPTIECTGPDGKHLYVTQKACDDFNNAWKSIPTPTPQQATENNKQYGGNSCGVNSHLSSGFCVCDSRYNRNHNTGVCE